MEKLLKLFIKGRRRGDGEIQVCISVIVFVMIAVAALNLASLFILHIQANQLLEDLSEVCATGGSFTDATYEVTKESIEAQLESFETGNLKVTSVTISEEAPDGYFRDDTSAKAVQRGNRMKIRIQMSITLSNFGLNLTENPVMERTRLSSKYFKAADLDAGGEG